MSSRRPRPGKTLSLGPPEGQSWVWMTTTMFGSITFRALGIHARRILDFLLYEHAQHGGRENGNLAAPYRQLEAWGVTAADVRKGMAELIHTGFVARTKEGRRLDGVGVPARYALTWLPTNAGSSNEEKPTHEWSSVIDRLAKQRVGNVAAARAWLRAQIGAGGVEDLGRGAQKRAKQKRSATPQVIGVLPLKCEAAA